MFAIHLAICKYWQLYLYSNGGSPITYRVIRKGAENDIENYSGTFSRE